VPWHAFLTVWAFLAMNIVTPGPNVLNTIALAIGSGRRAGFGSALGVGLGIGMWCLAMSLGLSTSFQHWPPLKTVMTLLACGLLVWFAARYLRAARAGWAARRQVGGATLQGQAGVGVGGAFLRALTVNASNPKALTTWVAVLAMFPVARATGADIALLCAGACVMSFSIHTLYALAFSTPLAARAYLRAAPVINTGVALFFLVFAARLAWSQIG
jgi:threonine/homoserine/homoserine lactone efflux protein